MPTLKKIIPAMVIAGAVALAAPPLVLADGAHEEATTLSFVKQETRDLLVSLKSYTAEQKDEAMAAIRAGLDKMDQRIDTLQAKVDQQWDSMDAAARASAHDSLAALKRQRVATAEWYGYLKDSSAESWDDLKTGFVDAYEEPGEAWSSALEAFSAG